MRLALMMSLMPDQNLQDATNVPASLAIPGEDGIQVTIAEL